MVFDDSSPANQEYYGLLEKTRTHNELYYVGPREKEEFVVYVNSRLRDKRLDGLVKNLFRPSYGGNRNFTLMYTLGGLVISADDDMRPYTLIEHSPESLEADEVCRGRLYRQGENSYGRKSFDIIAAFRDVLGKRVSELPDHYERGELIWDTSMDLETNATKGLARVNSLLLQRGPLSPDAVVKMAQTFRSGTNDIDALDYVEMFLEDADQTDPEALTESYVLINFRPVVTNKNWRMDCGVAGYDNTIGLPPFFPTRLRCEDYIYRLWIQKASVTSLDELSIAFDYAGEVSAEDAQEILDKIKRLHARAQQAAESAQNSARATALRLFAANLSKAFYEFEPDFFQQNLVRIVDDVVSVIKGSIELWPTLIEICYFHKGRKGLPQVRVQNQRK